MADKLEIYKGALRLLGPHELASLTEDRPERHKLDEAWPNAVAFMLEQGFWNFAIRTAELSNDEDVEPLFGYTYAFSKPEDWVRTVSLSADPTFTEGHEDYEDEQGYWYANIDPIYVRYVSDDTDYGLDVGAWRQSFSKTLEAYLAFECGLPISSDKGNRNDIFTLYKARLKEAKAKDAVDERVRRTPPGRLVRSRSYWRNRMNPRG